MRVMAARCAVNSGWSVGGRGREGAGLAMFYVLDHCPVLPSAPLQSGVHKSSLAVAGIVLAQVRAMFRGSG